MQNGWRYGYLTIAAIRLHWSHTASLKLGKRADGSSPDDIGGTKYISNREALRLPNAAGDAGLHIFMLRNPPLGQQLPFSVSLVSAADAVTSHPALRITVGRIVSGFISMSKSTDRAVGPTSCSRAFGYLPLPAAFSVIGIVLTGLGTSPVFPAMIHETPNRFGRDVSQAIVGLEMAVAYIGGTVSAPLFGQLASIVGIRLFPYYILACTLIMLSASELLRRRMRQKAAGCSA